MTSTEIEQTAEEAAPQAFKAWAELQKTLGVTVPDLIDQANATLNAAVAELD